MYETLCQSRLYLELQLLFSSGVQKSHFIAEKQGSKQGLTGHPVIITLDCTLGTQNSFSQLDIIFSICAVLLPKNIINRTAEAGCCALWKSTPNKKIKKEFTLVSMNFHHKCFNNGPDLHTPLCPPHPPHGPQQYAN